MNTINANERENKISLFFKRIFSGVKQGFMRFPSAFVSSLVCFILIVIVIFASDDEVFIDLLYTIIPVILLAVTLQLCTERYKRFQNKFIIPVLTIVSAFPFWLLSDNVGYNNEKTLAYIGVCLLTVILGTFAIFTDANRHIVTGHILRNLIFSLFIGLVLFLGLSCVVLALNYLIYEIPEMFRVILLLAALSYEICSFWIFLSGLPDENTTYQTPKAYKYVILYAAFPVYLLLIAVLYLYLIKILITFSLPGGQLNWFVSYASLFFIFFNLTASQFDYAVTKFYKRFGGWFMFPLLAVQALAIWIRFDAYGLTSLRWVSMILNLVVLVYVILSLIKDGKYIRFSLFALSAAVLVLTVGPLNAIRAPIREQTMRLERLLTANDILKDGHIIGEPELSEDDKQAIYSCWIELQHEDGVPEYVNELDKIMAGYGHDVFDKFTRHLNRSIEYNSLDISDYSHFSVVEIVVDNSEPVLFKYKGDVYEIEDKLLALTEDSDDEDFIFDLGNLKLYITAFDMMADDDNVTYAYIRGFAFEH